MRRPAARGYRRALVAGLAVSVVLHAGAILVTGWIGVRVPPYARGEGGSRPLAPLRLVDVRETPAAPPTISRPAPPRAPEEGSPEPEGRRAAETERAVEGEPALTNAERLRPRAGDPRLWRDFVLRPPFGAEDRDALTRGERALFAAVAAYLDSARLSEEQRRRLRDWTVGEGDERWGVSPEGIHLGEITIPVPWGQLFADRMGAVGEERRELRELSEIRWQEALRDVGEVMEERREAMRERRRRERAEREEAASAEKDGDAAEEGDAAESASDTTATRPRGSHSNVESLLAPGAARALLALRERP